MFPAAPARRGASRWFLGFNSGVGERPVRCGVDVPAVGHAFEFVFASVGEGEAGAGDQVADGARHEHFAGAG